MAEQNCDTCSSLQTIGRGGRGLALRISLLVSSAGSISRRARVGIVPQQNYNSQTSRKQSVYILSTHSYCLLLKQLICPVFQNTAKGNGQKVIRPPFHEFHRLKGHTKLILVPLINFFTLRATLLVVSRSILMKNLQWISLFIFLPHSRQLGISSGPVINLPMQPQEQR